MRIGISGASGFIGRPLAGLLKNDGLEVLQFSRKSRDGFYQITDLDLIKSCDQFIHLGEPSIISEVNNCDSTTLTDNHHFLETICSSANPRIIYISSAAVYGNSTILPHKPNENLSAKNAYTRMKISHELLCTSAGGIVLRLSNIFGSHMSSETAIRRISKQIINRQEVPLLANGIRDYLFIDEAVKGIAKSLDTDFSGILNLGSGRGRSIRELTIALADILKVEVKIIEGQTSEIDCCLVDILDSLKVLNWGPKDNFINQLTGIFSSEVFPRES